MAGPLRWALRGARVPAGGPVGCASEGGSKEGPQKGNAEPRGQGGCRKPRCASWRAPRQRRSGRQAAGRGAEPGREPRDTGREREGAREEAGTQAHDNQRHRQPGGSAEDAAGSQAQDEEAAAGLHWVCGLDTRPFRAWEAGTPNARRPGPGGACRPCAQPRPGLLEGRCPVLTGTMSPCQVSKLASSTWMLRKFFIPHLRISSSSCWLTKHRGVSHGGRHHGLPLLTPSN